MSTPAAIRLPIVWAEPQPLVGASEIAYTSSMSEAVIVTAPHGSKARWATSSRLSRT